MTGINTLTTHQWSLSSLLGYHHAFFIVNSETILCTWILLGILLALAILCRLLLYTKGHGQFIVLSSVESIMDMTKQSLGAFSFDHCAFMASLFTFIALANILPVIPWLDEPTNDINTTLALGCIAFLYTQYAAIKHAGIWHYFFPLSPMLPLNLIGKGASVVSLSFRLFGNITGGSIIVGMYFSQAIQRSWYGELIGIGILSALTMLIMKLYKKKSFKEIITATLFALFFSPNMLIILFFNIFEGFLQAFVFTMLSFTYLATALHGENSQ